jgi:hypothetical protein
MPSRFWLLLPCGLGLAIAVFAFGSCSESTDLGNPCRLMKPTGDGGLVPISVGDTIINNNFDFLSTGDSDCEDLICLRIHGPDGGVNTAYDDSDGIAHGSCSTGCIDKTDCGESSKGLVCQQLSFDQKFLDQLKSADPATYQEYFGDQATATYCVDPTKEPGGGTTGS